MHRGLARELTRMANKITFNNHVRAEAYLGQTYKAPLDCPRADLRHCWFGTSATLLDPTWYKAVLDQDRPLLRTVRDMCGYHFLIIPLVPAVKRRGGHSLIPDFVRKSRVLIETIATSTTAQIPVFDQNVSGYKNANRQQNQKPCQGSCKDGHQDRQQKPVLGIIHRRTSRKCGLIYNNGGFAQD